MELGVSDRSELPEDSTILSDICPLPADTGLEGREGKSAWDAEIKDFLEG
jgi:hypothetical protein